MFFWLLVLLGNGIEQDSVAIDSIQIKRSEIPEIIDFGNTGVLDSSLSQTRVIEPVLFLNEFKEFTFFTPYLIRDQGYSLEIKSPHKQKVLLHSHYLDNYFIENFNFVSLPVNFLRPLRLRKMTADESIRNLEIDTRVNIYDQPYSCLYFSIFGGNKYNLDFTRAITNFMGFYLGGLYSRQYKNSDHRYLRTNAGYANFYYNQLIPSRIDIIYTDNNYDNFHNLKFSDITLTTGNDFYKISAFRTANGSTYLDTTSDRSLKNQLTTYGANQRIMFSLRGCENIIGLDASTSTFKFDSDNSLSNEQIDFYQKVNYGLNRLTAGLGYRITYETDRSVYFNPDVRLKYSLFDESGVFGRLKRFYDRANFVARFGNENLTEKFINISGNPDIKDEEYLHGEIGVDVKNSVFSFYHSEITNQIVYQEDSSGHFSAVNIEKNNVSGLEGFFEMPIWKWFSIGGTFNYLLKSEIYDLFPKTTLKFWLNAQRKTERSLVCFFTRFNYVSERNDIAGNHYKQYWTMSPGLSIKFITLDLGMILENVLNESAGDFPNMERRFSSEVKWEFWD
ncbi:MAG: TonB-dependent receptor [candidate division WOR-3 bacterium]